ncbi:MAG: hypothetical protein JW934_09540 [Anaerolineae bacterium]|nr:hypothetical protein [Anaerolineae bacterium]
MPNPLQVILYGNSLFLSGVELTLRQCGDWVVLRLDPAYADAQAQLGALQAGILIYDAAGMDAQFAAAFLTAHPRMVVVGLDAAEKRALVWRGEQRTIACLGDLNDLLLDVQRSGQH